MADTQANTTNKARQRSSMTISQTTPEETLAGQLFCPRCNATVPARATFCGSCGERLKQKKQTAQINEQDIHTRYRITTLARRYPSCNLYFALDNLHAQGPGQARMVAMRDIDISVLDQETREKAIAPRSSPDRRILVGLGPIVAEEKDTSHETREVVNLAHTRELFRALRASRGQQNSVSLTETCSALEARQIA